MRLIFSQLENIDVIQAKRSLTCDIYYEQFKRLISLEIQLPQLTNYARQNAHTFYLVCKTKTERNNLMLVLKDKGINANSHYLSLNNSLYYTIHYTGQNRYYQSNRYADCLLRLPLYLN
jgi:dTDP-4-amino-4,6-dideoxygalactose transaminase